jgi:hypothetical protein
VCANARAGAGRLNLVEGAHMKRQCVLAPGIPMEATSIPFEVRMAAGLTAGGRARAWNAESTSTPSSFVTRL